MLQKKKDKNLASKNFLISGLVDIFNRQNIFSYFSQQHNSLQKKTNQNNILYVLSSLTNINDKMFKIKNNEKNIKFLAKSFTQNIHERKNPSNNKFIDYKKHDEKNIDTEYLHLYDISFLKSDNKIMNFIKDRTDILSSIKENKSYIKTSKSNLFAHKNASLLHDNTIPKVFLLKNLDKDRHFNDTIYQSLNKNMIKWKKAISQQFLFFVSRKENIAEIQIEPQDLGLIDIKIKIKNNAATLHFLSNCKKIKNILNNAMPILKSSLKKHDIKIDNINVYSPMTVNSQEWKTYNNFNKNDKKDIFYIKNTNNMLNLYLNNIKYFGTKDIDIYI